MRQVVLEVGEHPRELGLRAKHPTPKFPAKLTRRTRKPRLARRPGSPKSALNVLCSFKQVSKKGAQSRRLRDIQQKKFSSAKNPRAKLDGEIPDVDQTVEKYKERGFEGEVVGGS